MRRYKRYKKKNRWSSSSGEVKYRKWRYNVFELNKRRCGLSKGYICLNCSKQRKTTRTLHAHHIFSWHIFEAQRYDSKNGIVLCKPCHNKFHTKYGYKSVEDVECILDFLKNKKHKKVIQEYIKINK